MGNYRICDFCGNLYERSSNRMCQSCETIYQKIRSVVEARPDTIVLDISNQTGISVSRILSFVKNGYFVMREGTIEVK
ncbi:hypothetical protein DFP94_101276 [Fontibacillus phaseoli]|uniref:Flagellar operon protein (TIGR03826 family) n=1 Tax=Fontibacillus phaseoli TaxID=1416533 RepID=A0A369BNN2_9BACL|nr:hypothetical protein [Fontibacillus phaseoli]RCX22695.1 hypothetical protein DFP94_101276 [Fontibacillus phaseoli]